MRDGMILYIEIFPTVDLNAVSKTRVLVKCIPNCLKEINAIRKLFLKIRGMHNQLFYNIWNIKSEKY